MPDPRVAALCAEFGVEIVGKSRYPEPGQTRAPETIARILRRHGEAHVRLVLTTLRETSNNAALLDEVGLWAASDMIRAWPDLVEHHASDWLALWDRMEVGMLQFTAQRLRGVVPVRFALGGMLHERIDRQFGERAAEPDLFDGKEFA